MDTKDANDFLIKYDSQIPMIYAVSTIGNADFLYHRTYGYFTLKFNTPVKGTSTVTSSAVSLESLNIADPKAPYAEHGWWMWSCWCMCGWLMIATKRYMVKTWHIAQIAHTLIGSFISFCTLFFIIKILVKMGGTIESFKIHTFFGFAVLIICMVVWLTGALGAIMGRFHIGYREWKNHKEPHVKILKLHSFIARISIMWGWVACTTGIATYQ